MDPLHLAARHPAAVVHVPARGRSERLTLAALTTPIAIPRIAPADLDRFDPREALGGRDPGEDGFWGRRSWDQRDGNGIWARHAGGLWRRLQVNAVNALRFVGADELKAWISGGEEARFPLDDAFRGTPLAAWGHGRIRDVLEPARPAPRGEAVDVAGARAIRRDDRARAAAAVTAWAARNLLVAGEAVFERVAPVVGLKCVGSRDHGQVWLSASRRVTNFRTLYASPLTLAAAEARRGFGPKPERAHEIAGWAELGLDIEIEATAQRAFVDGLAGVVRLAHDPRMEGLAQGSPLREEVLALRTATRELELDALTGLAAGEDVLPALRVLERGLDAALAWRRWFDPDTDLGRVLDDLRDFYLPNALTHGTAPEPGPEDVEALGALEVTR